MPRRIESDFDTSLITAKAGRRTLLLTTVTTASLILLAPQISGAQEWSGATDSNLLEPTNWVGGAVPGDADGAMIGPGAAPNDPVLGVGEAKTFDRVDLEAGVLTIDGDLSVTTEMKVTDPAELAVSATGTVSGLVVSAGTVNNAGRIGALENSGTATNSGTIDGTVSNTGTFTSSGNVTGTLTNVGGTTEIEAGGLVAGATTISGGVVLNSGILSDVEVQAAGELQISEFGSAGNVRNEGLLAIAEGGTAGGVTNVAGADGSNAGVITSLINAGQFDNSGEITGNAENSGTLTNSHIINGDVANDGTFENTSSGSVGGRVNSTDILINAGRITRGISVDSGNATNVAGGVIEGASAVVTGALDNYGTIGAVDVAAGATLDNRSTGRAGAVSNAGTFLNENGGIVASVDNSADFENLGTVSGGVENRGLLTNHGTISGGVTNSAGTTLNEAGASIGGTSTIAEGLLENEGSVNAVTVNAAAGFNNRAGAEAGAVTNAGTYLNEAGAQTSLLVNSGMAINEGTITGTARNSATLNNAGAISGGVVNSAGTTVNDAAGTIGGTSTVSAGFLENDGSVNAVTVGAAGRFDNNLGATAGSVNSAGIFVNAAGAVAGLVENSGDGTNDGEIAGLINSGTFTSIGAISGDATSSGTFVNAGAIGGGLTTSGGETTNQVAGTVAGASSVTGGTLLNQGGVAAVSVSAGGIFFNEGTAADVTSLGTFENRAGAIAGAVDNGGSGSNAGRIASLRNSANFQNSGEIAGAFRNIGGTASNLAGGTVAGLTEVEGGIVNNAGTLAGVTIGSAGRFDNLALGQAGAVVNSGYFSNSATAVAGSLENRGNGLNDGEIASLLNSGTFTSNGSILGNATNSGTFNNSGLVGGGLLNTAGTTSNLVGGAIAGVSEVEGGALLNAGTLSGVSIGSAGSFTNQSTGVAGAVVNAGSFSNAAGGVTGFVTNSSVGSNSGRVDGLSNSGTFTNTGLIAGDSVNSGTLRSTGMMEGHLTNSGTAELLGSVTGTLENNGLITVDPSFGGATEALTVGGDLINNGTIDLTAATRSAAGGTAALTAGSLSGDGDVRVLVDFDTLTANRIAVAGALSGNVHLDFGNIGTAASGTDILVISSADASGVNLSSTVMADPSRITTAFRSGNNIYVRRDFNPAFGGLVGGVAMTQTLVSTLVNQPNRPFVTGGTGEKGCRPGGYLQAYAGRATMRGESTSSMAAGSYESELKARYSGLRAAWDYGCLGTAFAGERETRLGFQLGLSRGTTDQPIIVPGAMTAVGSTATEFRNRTFGVYVVHQLTDKVTGDLQLRHNSTKYTFNYTPYLADIYLKDETVKSNGSTVAANLSYSGVLSEASSIFYSLSGGISHTRNQGMTINLDATGAPYADARIVVDKSQTTLGVIGAQVSRFFESEDQSAFGQVFAGAKIYRDFAKSPTARHFDGNATWTEIKASNSGTFGEFSVGLDYVRDLAPGQNGRGRTLTTNLRLDLRGGANVRSGAGITGAIRIDF